MYKTLLFALTLALSAACLQAQDQSQSAATPSAGQTAASQTVEGCLQGSNGSFTLTDNSGTTYQLSGDNSKLADHVGHQVSITGSTSGASAGSPTSTATPSSSGSGSQTLTVDKVKMVSKTCKAAK